jgi:hypothetical protein
MHAARFHSLSTYRKQWKGRSTTFPRYVELIHLRSRTIIFVQPNKKPVAGFRCEKGKKEKKFLFLFSLVALQRSLILDLYLVLPK